MHEYPDRVIEDEPERSQNTALRIESGGSTRHHGGRFRVWSDKSRAVRGVDDGLRSHLSDHDPKGKSRSDATNAVHDTRKWHDRRVGLCSAPGSFSLSATTRRQAPDPHRGAPRGISTLPAAGVTLDTGATKQAPWPFPFRA
jgi:hypothetical protein